MKKGMRGLLTSSSMLFLALIACISSSSPSDGQAPIPVTGGEDTAVPQTVGDTAQHQDIPGELPAQRSSHAGDYDSSVTADQNRAPDGDRFTFGRYERPFNASSMDTYYSWLDIQDTLFYQDDMWFYSVITLKGSDSNGKLAGRYGVEIDLDLDGGGDWLVLANAPASTEWSTDGVEVWFDTDNDAGGNTKMDADNPPGGNGYETLVFGEGQRDDPDLAWARVSPNDPNSVQIA